MKFFDSNMKEKIEEDFMIQNEFHDEMSQKDHAC